MSDQRNIMGFWRKMRNGQQDNDTSWLAKSDRRKSREQRLKELRANDLTTATFSSMMPQQLPPSAKSLVKSATVPLNKIKPTQKKNLRMPSWLNSWWFWLCICVLIPGATGITAIALLLKLPARPDCEETYWPMASATKRIYCGDVLAQSQDVDSILQAISLVNSLPSNHPLQSDIDRRIEKWSNQLLAHGEAAFQVGKLDEAIAIAEKLPKDLPTVAQAQKQMKTWQEIWQKADDHWEKALNNVQKERWNDAYIEASRLLTIPNKYWETNKYNELTSNIRVARADGNKLLKARDLNYAGGSKNLLEALAIVQEVEQSSLIYGAAQKLLGELGNSLLNIAADNLDSGNWENAQQILSSLPAHNSFNSRKQGLEVLVQAYSSAAVGTASSLQEAIAQAKKINSKQPLYEQAQYLISRWQREVGDVQILEEARSLAQSNNPTDLGLAIAKLQTIPSDNPRGPEANTQIEVWVRTMQEQEDGPLLDSAERVAGFGDLESLQKAIATASQITRGRTLHEDAQRKINDWNQRVEKYQDQPILDNAQQLALTGNYSQAISLAETITPGRSLYQSARDNVRNWQRQLESDRSLTNARQVAAGNTVDSYVTAITLASKIPSSNPKSWEAQQAINEWSQNILTLAIAEVNNDLSRAIAIARQVPLGSNAYGAAQSQISQWQNQLNTPIADTRTINNPVTNPEIAPTSEPVVDPLTQGTPQISDINVNENSPVPMPTVGNQQ